MDNTTDDPHYLIPFISDFGFKKAFADESDTTFARKAIQVLASLPEPIKELHYIRNEFSGLTELGRAGITDIFCRDEKRHIFITEMQLQDFHLLFERLFFYVFHAYNIMVNKGKKGFGNVKPIFCICIVAGKMFPGDQYYQKISLKNQNNQTVFDKITFFIIELDKFTMTKEQCTTDLDKLIFTMKNGHNINLADIKAMPPFWKEEWFKKVVEKMDEAKMSPEQRFAYEVQKARIKSEIDQQKHKLEKAKKQGKKEGKKAGVEIIMKNTITHIYATIKDPNTISNLLGYPLGFVEKTIKELQDKPA